MADEPDGQSTGITQDRMGVWVGTLALQSGWITPEQLRKALGVQAREAAPGRSPRPLGEILVSLGFLSPARLKELFTSEASRTLVAPAGKAAAGAAAPKSVATLGKYQLLREVGRGGSAVVYEALDSTLGRRVALKLLSAGTDEPPPEAEGERLAQEARLIAALPRHPGIVGLYETGVLDGRRYSAMEYVEGLPLNVWRREKSPPLREQVRVLRDVALAVQHAHANGVIHRDLKPQNVLIDAGQNVHVVEFGLARAARVEKSAALTQTGFVVGTPGYLSPEQAEGRKKIDARTDVYALGTILYEILAGRKPFLGETPLQLLHQVIRNDVVPPSKLRSRPVDPDLEAICLRALSKRPGDRQPGMQALAGELNSWLRSGGVRSGPDGWSRWGTGVSAAAALLLVVLVALWKSGSAGPDRPEAAPGRDPALDLSRRRESPKPEPPLPPSPPAPVSSVVFEPGRIDGLTLLEDPDSRWERVLRDGVAAIRILPNKEGNNRLYFDVDDRWAAQTSIAKLEVECAAIEQGGYLDGQYDSSDLSLDYKGSVKDIPALVAASNLANLVATCILATPGFENRQLGRADFRLYGKQLLVKRVTLTRVVPASRDEGSGVPIQAMAAAGTPLQPGLVGEYFSGEDFTRRASRQAERDLRFPWPKQPPAGLSGRFSARWEGFLNVRKAGLHLFEAMSAGGLRVSVGGRRVMDDWVSHPAAHGVRTCVLAVGRHALRVEYSGDLRDAALSLSVFEDSEGRFRRISPACFTHE